MNGAQILQGLEVKNRTYLVVENQDVSDIIKLLTYAHKKNAQTYDQFAHYFDRGSLRAIARGLFNFCKANVAYNIETEKKQTVRTPGRILEEGEGDCKHYASFIAGVLDSLKRQGRQIDWCFRFASYKFWNDTPGHVFVVIRLRGYQEIWIDPVLDQFDEHYAFIHEPVDKTIDTMRKSVLGCMNDFTCGLGNKRMGAAVINTDPQSSGIYYFRMVFGRGFSAKHPGTDQQLQTNPPIYYTYNGQPFALPPQNLTPGAQVPQIPVGLTVNYADSFMGYPIPANFIRPVVVQDPAGGPNKLQLWPQTLPSKTVVVPALPPLPARTITLDTSAQLSQNDSFLLAILESAIGPLINAYSSYPYASNFSSDNNLDNKLFNERNKDNFLIPDPSKKTILQDAAPIIAVAAGIFSAIVPIAAPALALATKAAYGTKSSTPTNIVNTGMYAGQPVSFPVTPVSATATVPGRSNIGTLALFGGLALLLFSSTKHKRK